MCGGRPTYKFLLEGEHMNSNETVNAESVSDAFAKGFGKFVLWLLTFVASILFRGFVIQCLWNWFMSPLGLPTISITLGFGLSLFAATLLNTAKPTTTNTQKATFKSNMNGFFTGIGYNSAPLIFGWLVHLFM